MTTLQPISDSEYVLFCRLAYLGGSATVDELSSRRFRDENTWDYKTVGLFLNRLRAKGWVSSEVDPEKANRYVWKMALPVDQVLAYETHVFLERIRLLPIGDPRSALLELLSVDTTQRRQGIPA